ncbi:unnamed protein product [Adineta ricciae]|uniref:Uncharacterized protein n=1 Tax=Adineta ricciae TaxID=249248 RepID=A0A813XVY8_ADIRI|nr:unnamed protein product [Adineta ricciae]
MFVTVLYIVSYTNRNSNAILQVQHLSSFFCNTRSSSNNFTDIVSLDDYWDWLQTIFVTGIRIQPWYNGGSVGNMTDFLNDKSNRIIGWSLMRQLRLSRNSSCRVPPAFRTLIDSCKDSYSFSDEERQSYAPGWLSTTNINYTISIRNSFIYRSSDELDSYVYWGNHGTYSSGGFVYEFLGNFDEIQENLTLLRNLTWIDERSRAVMIQLNLYNPNVKLYTSVTLLVEILSTGEVFPSFRIDPFQMYTEFHDFSSIFYMVIAIIYILFIVYFTFIEIYSIYKLKKKYFRKMRSYIEWCMISCSWAGVGVYISRYNEAQRIGRYFNSTNGFQYINFQFATYLNDVLTFLLGFCCFSGTIRLLQLFEIYPRVNIFSRTLHRGFKEIAAFTMMYFLLFSAFVILFYLLFVSKMISCSSILLTAGMLFEMILLKFDTTDLQDADPFLGPFVFTLFIYFCVLVCFTMFIVIIIDHFRHVRSEIRNKETKQPSILAFIIGDISKRLGLGNASAKVHPQQSPAIVITRSDPPTPIEQLPSKLDELILALDRVHTICKRLDEMFGLEGNGTLIDATFHPQQRRRRKKHVVY